MSGRYETYVWDGMRESLFVHGPADGPRVLIVPPLFEELNFTRALVVAMARDLGARGIGAWIMDMPGANESPRMLDQVAWADMRGAVAAAADAVGNPHIASLRGGALLADAARGRSYWRFAATDGASLLRQMERAQNIGDRETGRAKAPEDAPYVDLIGYRMTRLLRETMRAASPVPPPGPLREVPFSGPGIAPWRRAEPAPDTELSRALAEDIALWIASCGG